MTPDVRTLRAAAMEAEARCNTACRDAQEAQWAAHCAVLGHSLKPAAVLHAAAEVAQERFYAAMAARDRARRALAVATMKEAS